jgi:hypothetical protein
MSDQASDDERVLELRGQGRSFSAIAQLVGYSAATEAPTAFNRALRRRSAAEQKKLSAAEVKRLDELEKKVRSDGDMGDAAVEKKLKAVAHLRALTLAP